MVTVEHEAKHGDLCDHMGHVLMTCWQNLLPGRSHKNKAAHGVQKLTEGPSGNSPLPPFAQVHHLENRHSSHPESTMLGRCDTMSAWVWSDHTHHLPSPVSISHLCVVPPKGSWLSQDQSLAM